LLVGCVGKKGGSSLAGGETVDAGFFSVTYPKEWTYDKEKASIEESYSEIKFTIPDEADAEKAQYSITVGANAESTKQYRKNFINKGTDLKDLADGKLNSIDVAETAFYETSGGSNAYYYRHDASGMSYYVRLEAAGSSNGSIDAAVPPFADIIKGIELNLTDKGEAAVPWPWEGTPWAPTLNPQMAGSFTITPVFLKADEPIILDAIMDTTFAVVGDKIYTVAGTDMRSYTLGSESVSLDDSTELQRKYELIRTDSAGKLYLSEGIGKIAVYDGFKQVTATEISQDLAIHKSGKWGISFWVNSDPMKVTVEDGILKEAPWVLTNIRDDASRKGFFSMISDVRISDSHIIVAGKVAGGGGEKIMVYDYKGKELFALENTKADKSGLGSVTGIVETKNGFLATDGNMRDIVLWNPSGKHIGTINVPDLIGAKHCWLEDMQLLDDGSILVGLSQERGDKSADELLFFRLSGF